MKLEVVDCEVFRRALQSIAKFVDRAEFAISRDGIHIRAVDPHDFCYADLSFSKSFFNGEFEGQNLSLYLDLPKLGRVLPTLSQAKSLGLKVNGETLEIHATMAWEFIYKISWSAEDSCALPKPKKISYEAILEIPAKDFASIIDATSAVSRELVFSLEDSSLSVTAKGGGYEFVAKPIKSVHILSDSNEVSGSVIASYLRTLRPLIEKCNTVKVYLGKETPVRFDLLYGEKAEFSFALSPKRLRLAGQQRQDRQGTSLPRLTASRFPDFVMYLASSPKGETTSMLEIAGLETSGGDYSRLAVILGMVTRNHGNLEITRKGLQFANLMKSSLDAARLYLHKLTVVQVPAYHIMIGLLRRHPMNSDDLFGAINSHLKRKKKHLMDRQDLSTLLGLAAWCHVVDRRMTLFYFGKKDRVD